MYTIQQAAKMLGVATSTMRRWEREGKIKSIRTTGNHRRYTIEELSKIKEVKPLNERITIGYCRVSSAEEREELKRQIDNVSMYCIAKGYSFRIIEDIGSGLDYRKNGLKELVRMIQSNQVERLVILYKDRLVFFGFKLLEQICEFHNTKIEIINHSEVNGYEQEHLKDLLSVVTSLGNQVYGKSTQKTKKLIKTIEDIINE